MPFGTVNCSEKYVFFKKNLKCHQQPAEFYNPRVYACLQILVFLQNVSCNKGGYPTFIVPSTCHE